MGANLEIDKDMADRRGMRRGRGRARARANARVARCGFGSTLKNCRSVCDKCPTQFRLPTGR
jgi:hypothetical protein